MTVAELRKIIAGLPDDAVVARHDSEHDETEVSAHEVREVKLMKDNRDPKRPLFMLALGMNAVGCREVGRIKVLTLT